VYEKYQVRFGKCQIDGGMGRKMDEMIAYCGLNCHTCAIYLATREKDLEKRNKMRIEIAGQINKHYDRECKPEDVADCDGCRTEDGRLFCGGDCQIRKCAREKGLENCAYCGEYACDGLNKLQATDQGAKKRLDEIRSRL
jgi:hypothetical protein